MSVSRRADLDWLRVLAFGLLIAYHAGMAWSGWSWHLTSSDSIDWLREGMRFVNRWRMPLLFMVSGAAIALALGARSPGSFTLDRVRRLLVPLVFGMVVIVPPQIYLERLYRGQFAGSLLWLAPVSFNTNGLIGDWHGLVYYGALLLYGALLFGSPALLAGLNRQRWLSFAIGVAAYATLYAVFIDGAVRPAIADAARPAYALVSALNTMAWLFAIVGFANRHLTRRPTFLSEATEAVYPFYILHQTVTVIAVYWLLQIGAPPVAGFILAVLVTFTATSAIYFGLVRPVWFLRPLFGLKAAYKTNVRPSSVVISRSRAMNFSSER